MKQIIKIFLPAVLLLASIFLTVSFRPDMRRANSTSQPASTIAGSHLIQADQTRRIRLSENYGKIPLSFELNDGQQDQQVQFLSRGRGYNLFLTNQEAVLALTKPNATESTIVRTKLVGANSTAKAKGEDELPGKANYFIGNDPTKWRTNVPTFAKVRNESVYPGIDLLYYGNQHQLEYDFVVKPGADPNQIRFQVSGADKMRVDAHGNLIGQTNNGEVRWNEPVIYQEIGGKRCAVNGKYILHRGHKVRFQVAAYDKSKSLVIDPTLVYSSYLGGSGDDRGEGIAVDSAGSAYIAGRTTSSNFPATAGAFQTANRSVNAFVTKFNPSGTGVIYSTYVGGTGGSSLFGDFAWAIAVDSAGNAYITGQAASSDFPVTPGAYQTTWHGGFNGGYGAGDAFVTKLDSTGSALVYSTFLGGSGYDHGNAIAIDSLGNAYVAGLTGSADFPTTVGPTLYDAASGFATELNATGTALVWSTYLGGSGQDYGTGIALDAAANAYVVGSTDSPDFPTTAGAYQTTYQGGNDGFLTKLGPNGTAVYSTYLGGTGSDVGTSIAVDSAGNAYVTGSTNSADFPTTAGAYQTASAGSSDAFVTKFDPTGSGLAWSTYLGGSGDESGYGIALDSNNNVYVAGGTTSTNFPTTGDAFQITHLSPGGSYEMYAAALRSDGSALLYSTYFGGSNGDTFIDKHPLALDSSANIYITGTTSATDLPTTAGAFQTTNHGSYDAFMAKFSALITYAAQVQPPINPDGSSIFNANRGVVPIKFALTDNGNPTCALPPATIAVTRTAGGTLGSVNESVYSMSADSGSSFRIDSCQYVYNLNSGALGAGTYRVDIMVNGQVVGSGTFALK